MKTRLAATIMMLAILLFLGGCSGGGDDAVAPTPTAIGTAVDLTAFKGVYGGTAPADTVISFNLTGSDNYDRPCSGSITIVSDGTTTFESRDVTKSRVLMTLTYTNTGVSDSVIQTYYFLAGTEELYKVETNNGTTSTPVTQSIFADKVHVGDFGELWVLSQSDGDKSTETWKIEPDYNGNSKLVLSSTTTNSVGAVDSLETDTFYIDSTGNPYRYNVVVSWVADDLTLTMSGNRV